MPLLTHVDPTNSTHLVRVWANVYCDPAAHTLEFGARVYSTPEAARERALARPIRENLTYLGPTEISATVSNEFIATGMIADRERFERVRAEAEARRAEETDDSECDPNPALPCRETLAERDGVEAPALPAPSTDPTTGTRVL